MPVVDWEYRYDIDNIATLYILLYDTSNIRKSQVDSMQFEMVNGGYKGS